MQKDFGYAYNKKIIPVNHLEGHISANYIEFKDLTLPFISLIISGRTYTFSRCKRLY